MSEVYSVMNLDKYAAYMRKKAATAISEDDSQKLDEFITVRQAALMIEEHSIGKDEDGRLLLDDDSHERLFESIKTRIYNCGLSKLAAEGLLECAWDSEKDEMVFWAERSPK
jgi:hypothetical protein